MTYREGIGAVGGKETLILLAVVCLLFPICPPAFAQQTGADQQARQGGQPADQGPDLLSEGKQQQEALKREAKELSRKAGAKIRSFAVYADNFFSRSTKKRNLGWVMFAGAVLVGLVSMFYGWAIVQGFLVPFAPLWGLVTGGSVAFCLVAAFARGEETWLKLLLVSVGTALGFGFYLFSALRARPIGVLLVVMSPFLIAAAFLFPFQDKVALVIFVLGFLLGFAAMIETRPLTIISTSIFGSLFLLSAIGLASHLVGDQAAWLQHSFQWLLKTPYALIAVWLLLAFIASNFQFMIGPRGALEE
ncbi:MAG: hypothetical protein J7M08_00690 [Planctomycetes bacterium]|nr:hypothetical protein [Planctomycetota bacterium]